MALASPGAYTVQYDLGATASIANFATTTAGFFTSTPTNAVVPSCNNVVTTGYADAALTTLFTSTTILPQTSTLPWDSTAPTTVDTAASRSVTLYWKGSHAGSTQSATKEFVINVCDGEVVSLVQDAVDYRLYQVGQAVTLPDLATLFEGYF